MTFTHEHVAQSRAQKLTCDAHQARLVGFAAPLSWRRRHRCTGTCPAHGHAAGHDPGGPGR